MVQQRIRLRSGRQGNERENKYNAGSHVAQMRCKSRTLSRMAYAAISVNEKFTKFSEVFQPKVIARMNDYEFKLARAKGDFVWHKHDETDEVFLIVDGELRIDKLMLIEPRGTVNAGDAGGKLTAPNDAWI